MKNSKIEKIRSHYQPRLARGGENHQIQDWNSAESQLARFKVLHENVALDGKTILDVGCGLGDLLTFIKSKKINANYTGVDILPEMLVAARKHHPEAKLICADIFDDTHPRDSKFDVVFCSGAFNLNVGDNDEFLSRAVERMLEIANEKVIFNLLNRHRHLTNDKYYAYDPAKVAGDIKSLGCSAKIIDGYLAHDFTVVCDKV